MAKTSSKASKASRTSGSAGSASSSVASTLNFNSFAEAQQALEAMRQAEIAKLTEQREGFVKQIAEVDQKLAELGAGRAKGRRAGGGSRAPRAKNETPLNQVVHTVLSAVKKPMHIKDIIEAVQQTDYKTNSKNWYSLVYTALKDEEMFKRSGEGRETVYSAVPSK